MPKVLGMSFRFSWNKMITSAAVDNECKRKHGGKVVRLLYQSVFPSLGQNTRHSKENGFDVACGVGVSGGGWLAPKQK